MNDTKAYLELCWDDQSADVIITVFKEGEAHHVGMQCKTITLSPPEADIDRMDNVKELLVQIVEML